jgi:hypothetical protein
MPGPADVSKRTQLKGRIKKENAMKKKKAVKKVVSKKKSAATRIKPVNMKSEKSKLNSKEVEGQSAMGMPKAGACVSWACAAVRG